MLKLLAKNSINYYPPEDRDYAFNLPHMPKQKNSINVNYTSRTISTILTQLF